MKENQRMKKAICFILTLSVIFSATVCTVFDAYGEVLTGECGENMQWRLKTNQRTLEITGTGEMYDYNRFEEGAAPWSEKAYYTETVSISEGITSIGKYAFNDCNCISVSLPDSLERIDDGAFRRASYLKAIIIPDNVTYLGKNVFQNCNSLKTISFGKGVTKFPNNMFYESNNNVTTEFIVPDSIIEIGSDVFDGFKVLEKIIIGKNVVSIGSNAFYECPALTSIYIPKSVNSIDSHVFNDTCTGLTNIYYAGSEKQWNDIDMHPNNLERIEKLTIHYNYNYSTEIPENPETSSDDESATDKPVETSHTVPSSPQVIPSTEDTTDLTKPPSQKTPSQPASSSDNISPSPSNTVNAQQSEPPANIMSVSPDTDPSKNHCAHKLITTNIISQATLTRDGLKQDVCSKCGTLLSTDVIKRIKSIKISDTSYTYTGKTLKKPTITVKDTAGRKLNKSCYDIEYIARSNNKTVKKIKAVGQYKVKITLKEDYNVEKYLYFSVKPQRIEPESVSVKNKSITVKWKKKKTVTGYQLQLSTNKQFTKDKKLVDIKKNTKASYKFPELKKGKRYYVKIRPYKIITVDGKKAKIYGSYSKAKSVRIK